MIYFDNAATTLQKPEEVGQAVLNALSVIGNSGRGAHGPSLAASRMIYDTREKLAGLFGIKDAGRISFTSNATEAVNTAVGGLLFAGDHVITTESEHNSVLRPLYCRQKEGVSLTILPVDGKGNISYEQLEKSFRKNTKAVILQHASNLTGNVIDIKKVSEAAKSRNALFVADAAQTAGCLPIDVEAQGIDVLCFTGHKGLMGPQGTGGIYVREGISCGPLKVGGSGIKSYEREHPSGMPDALEAGTLNGHGIAGLNAALDFILQTGVEQIRRHEMELADLFYQGIRKIDGICLYGDFAAKERVPIVSFQIAALDSSSVCDRLWEDYEICVRSGAHCAPLLHRALKTDGRGAVRFSFSWFNTKEEVNEAVLAVKEIAAER